MLGVGSVPMNGCGIYCGSRAVPSDRMTLSDQRSSISKWVRALAISILHESSLEGLDCGVSSGRHDAYLTRFPFL